MSIKKSVTVAVMFLLAAVIPIHGWSQIQRQHGGDNPLYKLTINVVERTTPAINYRHRGGSTTIDFKGTPLMPKASGEAKVESKQGYIEIEVEFDELQPATRFGPEYLTYVMWAITPEGRAINLGEVILNGDRSKLDVTTDMQTFGLVITAEPYFAVRQPSNVVVMENVVRKDTVGKVEMVDAKYELLERGEYAVNVPPSELKPIPLDHNMPLDLYEARNAVRIAEWAGADKDAVDTFHKAQALLQQAETTQQHHEGSKSVSMAARQAVQTAEDSREIALKRQADARAEAEREALASREAEAKAREADARAQADKARDAEVREAASRMQAEQDAKLEAERRARAEAEADRTRAEAELAAQRAANDRAAIEAQAESAREAAAQAQREKAELRKQLVDQFNLILETRDTARGLIVNMSDVLFDTGKSTLRPGAREKLAKIAGIVLSHPGLALQVEGHTDSVGSEDYNQTLSEKRADSVRDYLVNQGLKESTITAKGLGESMPVSDNATAAGRQQNRRVELVVSGDIIGTPLRPSSQQQ